VSTDQHTGHGPGEGCGGDEITSCDDVLSHVFEFLDRETDDTRRAVIAEHLEDCSPCLRQFGIEQEFKALVRRRCGGDPTPLGLRDRIKMQLTTVAFEEDGTQVTVERVSIEQVRGPGERPTA
jgi:mycothiol system anti-sigma-R factor